MFYAALDVSLRSVAICIIDQDGKVRLERSVPSELPELVRCLREFGEPIRDQCSEVQGYLLARPMAAAKVADMVAEHGAAAPHGLPAAPPVDLDDQRQSKRNRTGKRP